MKPDLLEILACPEDKATLQLHVEIEEDGEVLLGTLTCDQCGFVYPIEQGIPNLLPQEMHVDEVREPGSEPSSTGN